MGRSYARDWRGRFATTGGGGGRRGSSGRGGSSRSDNLLVVSEGGKVTKGTRADIGRISAANSKGIPVNAFLIRRSGGASFISSKSLAGHTRAGAKATRSGARNIGRGRAPGSSGYIITG